jgi:hypothetical protein
MSNLLASIHTILTHWRADAEEDALNEKHKIEWMILCSRLDYFFLFAFSIAHIGLTIWFFNH